MTFEEQQLLAKDSATNRLGSAAASVAAGSSLLGSWIGGALGYQSDTTSNKPVDLSKNIKRTTT